MRDRVDALGREDLGQARLGRGLREVDVVQARLLPRRAAAAPDVDGHDPRDPVVLLERPDEVASRGNPSAPVTATTRRRGAPLDERRPSGADLKRRERAAAWSEPRTGEGMSSACAGARRTRGQPRVRPCANAVGLRSARYPC